MCEEKVISSPKIKDVKILTGVYLKSLEDSINEAIKMGWEPYGEIKVYPMSSYFIMMVRYKEVNNG